MVGLHVIQQPLSVGHTIEEAPAIAVGAVAVQRPLGMESIELNEMVLGVGEELGALLEALGMGQVCRRQATSIPQAAQWEKKLLALSYSKLQLALTQDKSQNHVSTNLPTLYSACQIFLVIYCAQSVWRAYTDPIKTSEYYQGITDLK